MLQKHINNIMKDVSRSLYLSINVFPSSIRGVMGVGYLLCRAADTIVDCPHIDTDFKRKIIKLFQNLESSSSRNELSLLFKGSISKIENSKEKILLNNMAEIFDFYAALSDDYRNLVDEIVNGVSKGMEIDALSFPFSDERHISALKTESELEKYCSYIGGDPGVFWAKLYAIVLRGKSGKMIENFRGIEEAKSIGEALQITNILKDMAKDLRMGRCYLPDEDLRTVNLRPKDLLHFENIDRLKPIIFKWIMWAIDRLDVSEKFLTAVPKMEFSMRAAVIWPVFWAMDSLSEIVKGNPLDLNSMPKINRRKIYSTIIATPPLLLSNTAFVRGYRFRRETLIVSISGQQYE